MQGEMGGGAEGTGSSQLMSSGTFSKEVDPTGSTSGRERGGVEILNHK